jgi:hypothetical protein
MKLPNYVGLHGSFRRLPIVVCALFLACSCTKSPGVHGDAAATYTFWEALQKREDFGDAAAAIAAWESSPATANVQAIRELAVMEVATAMLTQRNEYLGRLPMKDVDPALLDYAARLAAANAARLSVLAEVKAAAAQAQSLTDPARLGIDALASLLRHMNDKAPFESMLREQFTEKARTLGNTVPQAQQLQAKLSNLERMTAELGAAEIAVRAELQRHHSRDFPPSASYVAKPPAAETAEQIFTRRRLMLDAMGQTIGQWTFEALSEIKSFEVTKRVLFSDNTGAAAVKCVAVGKNTGNRYELDFAMAYQKRGNSWVMLGLKAVN